MIKLTKKQIEIIEPIKKITGIKFYKLQRRSMEGKNTINDNNLVMDMKFNKIQINKLLKIQEKIKEYNNSREYGMDLIRQGTEILEELM